VKIYFAGPLFATYERGFIDECAVRLRAEGFDVFVPHEHELALTDVTSESIFAKDMEGLGSADAVVALLDGPMIDDGTACEIGIFWGLAQSDPSKKGVIGLNTDFRGARNRFVRGCIGRMGEIVTSIDEVVAILHGWE
jgi:nucleoside 2-deoxyribosyltransferase